MAWADASHVVPGRRLPGLSSGFPLDPSLELELGPLRKTGPKGTGRPERRYISSTRPRLPGGRPWAKVYYPEPQ